MLKTTPFITIMFMLGFGATELSCRSSIPNSKQNVSDDDTVVLRHCVGHAGNSSGSGGTVTQPNGESYATEHVSTCYFNAECFESHEYVDGKRKYGAHDGFAEVECENRDCRCKKEAVNDLSSSRGGDVQEWTFRRPSVDTSCEVLLTAVCLQADEMSSELSQ